MCFRSFGGAAAFVGALLLLLPCFAKSQNLQDDGTSCRLVTFIPFTDSRPGIPSPHNEGDAEYLRYGYNSWPDEMTLTKAAFSFMAAAEMARTHFNDRNPVIVKELASDEMQQCNIQIPEDSLYLDSSYSRGKTVNQLMNLWDQAIQEETNPDELLCGIVGPLDAQANEGAAVLTESRQIPQLAYATIEHRLSRAGDFPTFRRVIPRAEDFAWTIAEYVQRDVWQRDYVAIIYDSSDYGEQFEDPLEDAEELYCYATMTESIKEGDTDSITESLGEAKAKGYRTIVLITARPSFLDDIAAVAEELEMLGDEYFYLISGDAFPPALDSHMKFEVDSPTDKLLRGAALFTNYDRFVYHGESDPFLQEWRKQDASLVGQLNDRLKLIKLGTSNNPSTYTADATYFETETPTEYASFMYDTIMTAGMSACKAKLAVAEAENNTSSTVENRHIEFIGKTEFQGASGPVSFYDSDGEEQTSRNAEGVLFGMYNVRPGPVDADNMRGYQKVLTSIHSMEHKYEYDFTEEGCGKSSGQGAWEKVEGTSFVFFDQTSDEPQPLMDIDYNYLSDEVRATGFFLIALALLICIATGIWVYWQRTSSLVKASQPEFICLLCLGAAMVSVSVIFFSFDESDGLSEKQLNAMCASFPWFFVVGYLIMYTSIYCKMWRLSKLLQMRRRVVGIKQVLLPFMVVMSATLIILVLWQAINPLHWERATITDFPVVSFGECDLRDSLAFIVPILFLFFGTMTMAAVVAWRMKDVQAELSESRWIFYGIFTHIQLWALGVPMLVITEGESKDAQYLMWAALCFIIPTSMVALVVWPKVFTWVRNTYFPAPTEQRPPIDIAVNRKNRVSVSGIDDFRLDSSFMKANKSSTLSSDAATKNNESSKMHQAPNLNMSHSSLVHSDVANSIRKSELEKEVEELKAKLDDKGDKSPGQDGEIAV